MNAAKLAESIRRHEGLRLKVYRCPAGKWSIGYGRNVEDKGITIPEAEAMLMNDVMECYQQASSLVLRFDLLSDARQNVLAEMVFQLGRAGVEKFRHFLAAVDSGDHNLAADSMLASKWAATDSPARAQELADIWRRGDFS